MRSRRIVDLEYLVSLAKVGLKKARYDGPTLLLK